MYQLAPVDIKDYGSTYVGPSAGQQFEHGTWTLCGRIEAKQDEGQTVEIFECRWPARFFMIRAAASVSGKPAFSMSTGSGDQKLLKLVIDMSREIAAAHLGMRED